MQYVGDSAKEIPQKNNLQIPSDDPNMLLFYSHLICLNRLAEYFATVTMATVTVPYQTKACLPSLEHKLQAQFLDRILLAYEYSSS
jgi:hypothetical protein